MPRDHGLGEFGFGSELERRRADLFFNDLFGRRRGALAFETAEDTPTITLSTAEVQVCVGGINNATISATVSGGSGTVSWSIGDPTRASITAAGNTATIRGLHPGATTVSAKLTSGGTTVSATARLLVVFVQLLLRNSGTIEPAPENEDEATERAAAGGTNVLGPLPMGTGRGESPGEDFTSPIMVVGRVFPEEAVKRFTFRWQRLIDRRSWRFRRNAGRWNVTRRSRRGPLDDDTGADAFNDATPSTPGRRIYIYDNSAINLNSEPTIAIGDFVHEKKDFIYRVWVRLDTGWTLCSAIHVGQIIVARRTATGGAVATDWAGVENTNAIRHINPTVNEAQVRAIVGGADPIDIAATANN